MTVLKQSTDLTIDPGYLSTPQPIEFPTEDGLTAYGLYYPPQNRDYVAPEGEKPPLLVLSHGGPTGATSSALSLSIQYWTSRGFRGARRELRRQYRLRTRLPRAAQRTMGHRRCGRLRQRRAIPGRAGRTSTRSAWRSAAAARVATPP